MVTGVREGRFPEEELGAHLAQDISVSESSSVLITHMLALGFPHLLPDASTAKVLPEESG